MKPGDVLPDGLIAYHACAVLNDLDILVALPSFVLDDVRRNSGIIPEWPLGIYVVFTEEGILLGIHGKNGEGDFEDKVSFLELKDDEVPEIGEEIWTMWKIHRSASDESVEVNYKTLLDRTLEKSN